MPSNLASSLEPPRAEPNVRQFVQSESRAPHRLDALLTLFDLFVVGCLAALICFTNLSSPSIGMGDETIYVRAAQGMQASGDYLSPLVDTTYFYGKPPLRMWLTPPATSLLGQSSFALRAPDAACGVLLALLLYSFARVMFRSRLTGLLSCVALFGCSAYVLNHGPRMAVIDSLLTLLFASVMFCAWKVFAELARSTERHESILLWSVLGGIGSGLCILAKSGAGVVPLLVLAVFTLLSGKLRRLWREASWSLWTVLGLTLLISSPYFLYHCAFSNGACKNLIGLEVVERAISGFHNTDKPLFYFTRIFADGAFFPPLLILGSMAYGLYLAAFRRSSAALFLLCWAIVPVLFYSAMASRLTWYITPAAPAVALLIGLLASDMTHAAVRSILGWAERRSFFTSSAYALVLLVGLAYYLLGKNVWAVYENVSAEKERLKIDQLVHSVLNEPDFPVLRLFNDELAWDERAYLHMLGDRLREIASLEEAVAEASSDDFKGVVLTDFHQAIELIRRTSPLEYSFIAPHWDRARWMTAVSYGKSLGGEMLSSLQRIDFGSESFEPLFGWESGGSLHGKAVRKMTGSHAGFLVRGDFAYRHLGTTVSLKSAYLRGRSKALTAKLKLYINDNFVESIEPNSNGFSVAQFEIEPGVWQAGTNSLVFRAESTVEGTALPEHSLIFDWMILRPVGVESGK